MKYFKKLNNVRKEDEVILSKLKSRKLRYCNAGWTRIYPFSRAFETPTILTKKQRLNEAHFILEFGDQLDYKLLVVCKCVDIKMSTVYRICFEEIIDNSSLRQSKEFLLQQVNYILTKLNFTNLITHCLKLKIVKKKMN